LNRFAFLIGCAKIGCFIAYSKLCHGAKLGDVVEKDCTGMFEAA
jgi:hypothetical protein